MKTNVLKSSMPHEKVLDAGDSPKHNDQGNAAYPQIQDNTTDDTNFVIPLQGQHQQQRSKNNSTDINRLNSIFNPLQLVHPYLPSPFMLAGGSEVMRHNPSTPPMIWREGLRSVPPPNPAALSAAFLLGAAWAAASAHGALPAPARR